jgi:hypothetical protein
LSVPEQENYLIQLSEQLVPLIWQTPPPDLSAPERVFICIWQLESEINNGGFHQYYFNSAGDLAIEAPSALEAIGAPLSAEIVRGANAVFPGGPSPDRDAREESLEGISDDEFEQFDDRFLEYQEDLSFLLYTYVQTNREEIRGS